MQREAAQTLQGQIMPGTDMNDVVSMIGPGSLGWPKLFRRDYSEEGVISFNVRSWYNNGLDIRFQDGKVVSVYYFD